MTVKKLVSAYLHIFVLNCNSIYFEQVFKCFIRLMIAAWRETSSNDIVNFLKQRYIYNIYI